MRIVAGSWKGLQLTAPTGAVARPTTDRVKESMFQLLGIRWPGAAAVDLFSGSGALGLEALSRGATHAYLIDNNSVSLAAIRANVERCQAQEQVTVWRCDWRVGWNQVVAAGKSVAWTFVDPPYAHESWDDVLAVIGTTPGPLTHGVVCEHPAMRELGAVYGCLRKWKFKRYGDIGVSVYHMD